MFNLFNKKTDHFANAAAIKAETAQAAADHAEWKVQADAGWAAYDAKMIIVRAKFAALDAEMTAAGY